MFNAKPRDDSKKKKRVLYKSSSLTFLKIHATDTNFKNNVNDYGYGVCNDDEHDQLPGRYQDFFGTKPLPTANGLMGIG